MTWGHSFFEKRTWVNFQIRHERWRRCRWKWTKVFLRKRVTACGTLPQLAFSWLKINHKSLVLRRMYNIWHTTYDEKLKNPSKPTLFEQTKRFEKYFVLWKWSVDDARAVRIYATISRPNKFKIWSRDVSTWFTL